MSDKDKKQAYPVINIEECKACGRCVLACPVNVLELGDKLNKRGYRYCVYKGSGCIGCGNCFYTCPEPSAIEVHIPVKKTDKKPSTEQ
jgi:NAD-dependent dihydropyrimidine dehydrogenase PreA subunit